jgi:cyclophilin family peptidyl-prolyl cis-trans isomerase
MYTTTHLLTRASLAILSLFLFQRCSKIHPVGNSFADPVLCAIAQASDERNTQALSAFLTSENSKHQAYAAQCFGSFGDSIPVGKLVVLMQSKDSTTCHHAAWAIGQKGDSTACYILIDAWRHNPLNTTILEAIAKSMPVTASPINQNCLGFFESLPLDSDMLVQGFANATFHLHYRKIFSDSLLHKLLATKLEGRELWMRKAQAIGRFRQKMNDVALTYLASYQNSVMVPDIELALMPAFNHLSDSLIHGQSLTSIHSPATDSRVALGYAQLLIRKFPDNEVLWRSLYDHQLLAIQQVALDAALQAPYLSSFAKFITTQPHTKTSHPAHYAYYQMKLGHWTSQQFQQHYLNQPESYDRITYVPLFGTFEEGIDWIYAQIFTTTHLALRYTLAEEWMRVNALKSDKDQMPQWRAIWDIQDIGINALMCEKLPALIKDTNSRLQWLEELLRYQQTLQLPQEVETYEAIRICLETLEPANRRAFSSPTKQSLPWTLIHSLPEVPQVEIKTSKGDFTMSLDLLNAPGSVSNFIALVQTGFYNNKYFHRMVPNFVVQGGCPRGDGMGSTAYTIRSEFLPATYSTGTVGLASSGRDTESCQWFVSLLPTPHLDGRYSIIGHVQTGMEVVQSLVVGDQIIVISPMNF